MVPVRFRFSATSARRTGTMTHFEIYSGRNVLIGLGMFVFTESRYRMLKVKGV